MTQRWTFEVHNGASKAKLLRRDGVPVAKFYADRLTVAEMESVATAMNGGTARPYELKPLSDFWKGSRLTCAPYRAGRNESPSAVALFDRVEQALVPLSDKESAAIFNAIVPEFETLRAGFDALRTLRGEVRDWQAALSGERAGLDDLCARIDALLDRGI